MGARAGAGIQYRIDLVNEGTPTSGQMVLRQYAQRLWADYTFVFGKSDTLGFSSIASALDRISREPLFGQGALQVALSRLAYQGPYGVTGYPRSALELRECPWISPGCLIRQKNCRRDRSGTPAGRTTAIEPMPRAHACSLRPPREVGAKASRVRVGIPQE